MTISDSSPNAPKAGPFERIRSAFLSVCRGLIDSLPGQLLMLTIGLSAVGVAMVYFPAAANFRVQWMVDRAQAAHLAAMAADVAPGGGLGEEEVRALLMGAEAVAVARVRNGMNELVLYSGPVGEELIESDLRTAGPWDHIRDTMDTLFGPPGRLLRIRAEPVGYPGEVIDVILQEEPLKNALAAFSTRLLIFSVIVAVGVGLIIYLSLFYLFVRPMRRLAAAMIRFRDAPDDPARMVTPSGERNEIGQAEQELAQMQADVRQALQQRERLAALGEAVSKINHDLRNVLTSAQLVSDRLATDNDDRVRGMGERLVRAVDRGVRLCEATLEYGRAEDTPPQRVHLGARAVLDEAASDAMLAEGEVEWVNSVDDSVLLHADPDHAHRIFLNLFRNAIQAMHAVEGERSLSAEAVRDGDDYRITVRDTGPGLPPKARDNLFKAFSGSTKRGGTGLGLTIARELARGHGGDVELLDTGEAGTTFIVRLPSVEA